MTDLPDSVANHPLRQESEWLAKRDSGISPRYQSELVTDQRTRDEFLVGAWLLGILATVHPQMLRIADALAAGKLMNAVMMPRRSAKTTTLLCILLGRCYLRPVYMAGFTLLTTAQKARERYRLDVYAPISRQWPDSTEREAFDKGAPVKLVKSNGSERVEFSNGSVFAVLSPEGDAIRSGAYDALLADESGEASPEKWEDVIGAVIPSFDTRPEGQLILAGTAGDYRARSEFWGTLNDPDAGVVNYSLPDDLDPEELEAWEPDEEHPKARARELTLAMHPGIGTLTTEDRIANGYKRLGVKKFTREYWNIFGTEGSNIALIPQPLWVASGLQLTDLTATDRPEVCSLSMFVHPDADWASLVQSWTGEDGRIHLGVLHHQDGVKGFAGKVLEVSREFNRPVTYDTSSRATENIVRELQEAYPAPLFRPLISKDVGRAAVYFMTQLREDKLRHYNQEPLNDAAAIAVKRNWGTGNGWSFGRADVKNHPEADITPIEAAAMAVYVLKDELPTTGEVTFGFYAG